MADGFAKTPRYVLKDGAYPTFPSVLQISPYVHRNVIYGFSDKPEYDVFLSGSSIALTPYSVDSEQVDLIAHGIPDVPETDQSVLKEQFGVEDKPVALTFGLLSPGKGIEHVLQAIPEIVAKFPDFIYIVLGATHPSLLRDQGERYRISLERMAKELGASKHVSFYNRFVELEELTEFIGAADLYITPYLNVQQAVSGTLAHAFGCGQAVISTPYWHAEETAGRWTRSACPVR